MELIGLSGYARSGKDEAAKVLVEEFGFQRVAFADKLRDFLYALNPMVKYIGNRGWQTDPPVEEYMYVQDVIDHSGWNGYKETEYGDEIRRLLQRLGTEAGRQTLWDSIWIDAALNNLDEDAKVVVTDARFPNEAEAIKTAGGQIWRVSRLGVGPANAHASENSLDNWTFDRTVYNDGTLGEYHATVRKAYQERFDR